MNGVIKIRSHSRLMVCTVFAALVAQGLYAAPRLWVEARLDPPEVPVNAQATFVLRFGHAVEVRSPRLEEPRARLAETIPLGPVVESETTREGVRYRVLERRFAIMPFASGVISLSASVSGTTPAMLPEIDGRTRFSMPSPTLPLNVRPAVTGNDWLPAEHLQIFSTDATLPTLHVGEVWRRQLVVEAKGVDGSVIPPLRWPKTTAWSLQFDPPEVGHRVERGRLIGYRRETVHAQAQRPGKQVFPEPHLNWWQAPSGPWRESTLVGASINIEPSLTAASQSQLANSADELKVRAELNKASESGSWTWQIPVLLLVLGAGVYFIRGYRILRWRSMNRFLGLIIQRRKLWQTLDQACRANDPQATRKALLAWAAVQGLPALSLGALAESCDQVDRKRASLLADAIIELEAACYASHPPSWCGSKLRNKKTALAEIVRIQRMTRQCF